MSLHLFARITPKPQHMAEARAAILNAVPQTLAEPGCHQFTVHETQEGDAICLYEEWADQAALDTHYAMPYIAEIFALYEAWLAKPVEITKMKKLS